MRSKSAELQGRRTAARAKSDAPVPGIVDLKPNRKPIDWEEAARLYVEEKWPFARIAAKYRYTTKRVRQGLAERGVCARPRERVVDVLTIRLHGQWVHMHRKCRLACETGYATAGAIGIRVCSEWNDFECFRTWALEHGYEVGMTLVRVDPLTDFQPDNSEFVPSEDVRGVLRLSAFGESKSLSAWSRDERCVVSRSSLATRLRRGIAPEQAIAAPPEGRFERARATRAQRSGWSHVDWSRARALYEDGKLSLKDVALEVGCEVSTSTEGLHRSGVAMRRNVDRVVPPDARTLRNLWSRLRAGTGQYRVDEPARASSAGRATPIDPRWERFDAFLAWAHVAGWKPGLCLGRIDKGARFSPENCRWMTRPELTRSRRPPSRPAPWKLLVTAFGETKGVTEWSRDARCTVSLSALCRRLRGGLHAEDAITDAPQNAARTGQFSRFLEAFGETKSFSDWVGDPRCRVTATGLQLRLQRGMSAEVAISTSPFDRRQR